MRYFKGKKVKNRLVSITVIMYFISFILIFNFINDAITNKLMNIVKMNLDNYNNKLMMNFVSASTLSKSDLNSLIILTKNDNNEIISVDYDVNKSYEVLRIITEQIYNGLKIYNYEDKNILKQDDNTIIINYPIGLASNKFYLNNLGPIIPVKVSFIKNLVTGIKTVVKNYGINSLLMEIYFTSKITDNIIVPFYSEDIIKEYNILLSSKVIMGKIPTYYGSSIESLSPILTN